VRQRLSSARLGVRPKSSCRIAELRSLVAGIGEQLHQEWIQSEQSREQQNAAGAVLDVRGMYLGGSNKPTVSTGICRLIPLIFLPAS
jgi:hypothetical protein